MCYTIHIIEGFRTGVGHFKITLEIIHKLHKMQFHQQWVTKY